MIRLLGVVVLPFIVAGCFGPFFEHVNIDPTTVGDLRRQVPVYSENDLQKSCVCNDSAAQCDIMQEQALGSLTDAGRCDRSVTCKSGTPWRKRLTKRGVRGTKQHQLNQELLGIAELPRRCNQGYTLKTVGEFTAFAPIWLKHPQLPRSAPLLSPLHGSPLSPFSYARADAACASAVLPVRCTTSW